MAEAHGRRLSDPEGERQSATHVFQRHAEVAIAAGEAIATGATAQADGDITPAEAEMMDRAYGELERKIGAARKAVAGIKLKVVGGSS
jgi:hypothetical protein